MQNRGRIVDRICTKKPVLKYIKVRDQRTPLPGVIRSHEFEVRAEWDDMCLILRCLGVNIRWSAHGAKHVQKI